MIGRKAIGLAIAAVAHATIVLPQTGVAQTFQTYRCVDGTQFILGFYDADPRAFVQIDGKSVLLSKRLAASGSRYSGQGVTLRIGKTGVLVKHLKRPVTSCELT